VLAYVLPFSADVLLLTLGRTQLRGSTVFGIAPEVGPFTGRTAVELKVTPCLSSSICCEASARLLISPGSIANLKFSRREVMIKCNDIAAGSQNLSNVANCERCLFCAGAGSQ
jgi:hypothetical protein